MTKKDYIKLAAAFAISRPEFNYDNENTRELVSIWKASVLRVTDVLQADNDRFDRARFLKACGV